MIINTVATWDYDFPCWCIEVCDGFHLPIHHGSDNFKTIFAAVGENPRITKVDVEVDISPINRGSVRECVCFTIISVKERPYE